MLTRIQIRYLSDRLTDDAEGIALAAAQDGILATAYAERVRSQGLVSLDACEATVRLALQDVIDRRHHYSRATVDAVRAALEA